MRRSLGPLALAGLLTLSLSGCGSEGDRAADPAPSESTSESTSESAGQSTGEPATPDAAEVVDLVSATAAGGEVAAVLTPIADEADLAAFSAQFRAPGLAADLRAAYDAHPPTADTGLGLAVVAVGCDVPPGVTVEAAGEGYAVTAQKVADPLPECLAAVTTVAVVRLPA